MDDHTKAHQHTIVHTVVHASGGPQLWPFITVFWTLVFAVHTTRLSPAKTETLLSSDMKQPMDDFKRYSASLCALCQHVSDVFQYYQLTHAFCMWDCALFGVHSCVFLPCVLLCALWQSAGRKVCHQILWSLLWYFQLSETLVVLTNKWCRSSPPVSHWQTALHTHTAILLQPVTLSRSVSHVLKRHTNAQGQIPIHMSLRPPLCTVFLEHTLSHTQSSTELLCHINSHHTRLSLTKRGSRGDRTHHYSWLLYSSEHKKWIQMSSWDTSSCKHMLSTNGLNHYCKHTAHC